MKDKNLGIVFLTNLSTILIANIPIRSTKMVYIQFFITHPRLLFNKLKQNVTLFVNGNVKLVY